MKYHRKSPANIGMNINFTILIHCSSLCAISITYSTWQNTVMHKVKECVNQRIIAFTTCKVGLHRSQDTTVVLGRLMYKLCVIFLWKRICWCKMEWCTTLAAGVKANKVDPFVTLTEGLKIIGNLRCRIEFSGWSGASTLVALMMKWTHLPALCSVILAGTNYGLFRVMLTQNVPSRLCH